MTSRPAARSSVASASTAAVGDGRTAAIRFETDTLTRFSPMLRSAWYAKAVTEPM